MAAPMSTGSPLIITARKQKTEKKETELWPIQGGRRKERQGREKERQEKRKW